MTRTWRKNSKGRGAVVVAFAVLAAFIGCEDGGVGPTAPAPVEPPAGSTDGPKLYWSSWAADGPSAKIARSNLDGTGIEVVIVRDVNKAIHSIAVHDGKIYWTEHNLRSHDGETVHWSWDDGRIFRANLDGTDVEKLIETDVVQLVVYNNNLYWIALHDAPDFGVKYKIWQASLTGAGAQALVVTDNNEEDVDGYDVDGQGEAVALAVHNGVLYWIQDATTGRYSYRHYVRRANVPQAVAETIYPWRSTSYETLYSGEAPPYFRSITIYQNEMYLAHWYGGLGGGIKRANLDGTDMEDFISSSGGDMIRGIAGHDGKIYWTYSGSIFFSNLDGTELDELVYVADSTGAGPSDLILVP